MQEYLQVLLAVGATAFVLILCVGLCAIVREFFK